MLQPKLVQIKESWKKSCKEYADAVVGTVNYADSRQSNGEKVKNDHYIGKVAEFCAYQLLSKEFNLHPPDCAVYKGKGKGWESDLQGEQHFAIKSQTVESYRKYGASLMFQDIKGGRRDPILDRPSDRVCWVLVAPLYGIVCPPIEIKDLIMGEPKLFHLKGKKTVAYLEESHPKFLQEINRMLK